ncbi:MAG: FtsX-like permease family protein [Nitrospinota bacterium]|nr:FtsX-like permease family protein [Nitrospinota bacterium]MDH5756887.1 FtsX-like permease family protein [Nitrospinota bacterium]
MSPFKMAWRNLWRNRRRTIATTSALTLALLVTVLYSSMLEGYLVNMISDSLDYEIGAAQVFAEGYQEKPSIYTSMEDSEAIVNRLEKAGLPATERLLGAGLAAAGDSSAGAQLLGVDVAREANVLTIHLQIHQGQWLDPEDPSGVVLGRKLANTLGVEIGQELVVLSQRTDGGIANELYHVRGVLRNVGDMTDRAGLFMTAPAFRELMSFPQGAHQILIKRQPDMLLPQLKQMAQQLAQGRVVQTWRQLIPALATMIDSSRGMILFMFFILNVVVGIVISNAMLMAVFERIKEFGVFKALGASPGSVLLLIYLESMMQVMLAIVLGGLVSVPLLWYLSTVGIDMKQMAGISVMGIAMASQWKAIVTPQTYGAPVVMMLLVVSIAVIYPSVKAAFIKPVEAMRYH